MIASFDIDGVIFMGEYPGVHPGFNDIIITGRSYQEMEETSVMLMNKGILNEVFYNRLPFNLKTRESSGLHKGTMIQILRAEGYDIGIHYEDDPIQADVIRRLNPDLKVVLLEHDLVEKENVRHAIKE